MATMQSVERVYLHQTKSTSIMKTKRHDYKNGGFRIEERQTVHTCCMPYSLLSCGHTRMWQPGENFSKSKRLSCRHCDSITWRAKFVDENLDTEGRAFRAGWLAEAEESARENERSVAEHSETWLAYG